MKVAFDEHVPPALARVLQSFSMEKKFRKLSGELEVQQARDFAPKVEDPDFSKGSDVPWIRRFAKSGGKVIISGDTRMMTQPHERLALLEEGMIVVFFGSQWSNWQFFRKCSLILCWWPRIANTVKKADKGTFWRVPTNFNENGSLEQLSTEDRKLVKIVSQRAAQPKVAKLRKAARGATTRMKQGDFGFPKEDRSDVQDG